MGINKHNLVCRLYGNVLLLWHSDYQVNRHQIAKIIHATNYCSPNYENDFWLFLYFTLIELSNTLFIVFRAFQITGAGGILFKVHGNLNCCRPICCVLYGRWSKFQGCKQSIWCFVIFLGSLKSGDAKDWKGQRLISPLIWIIRDPGCASNLCELTCH